MGRRSWLTASLLSAACVAGANNPFPAVDLPSVVPESVRDQTARALASTRDQLGWAIHPFRGEFHGLGNPAGGASEAFDLSANGRVVVGADRGDSGRSRAFVWSPWTGRAQYDMGPGDTVATAISADGVYVAGNAGSHAFRWSLAGKELIPASADGQRIAAALSGNGKSLVGTQQIQLTPAFHPYPITVVSDHDYYLTPVETEYLSSLTITPWKTNQAYQYTPATGPIPYAPVEGYEQTNAIDIATDGAVVLGNASRWPFTLSFGGSNQTAEPIIWRGATPQRLGGLYDLADPLADDLPGSGSNDIVYLPQNYATQSTTAAAISADGSTVVGKNGYYRSSLFTDAFFSPKNEAVLWREETGWISLGKLPPSSDIYYYQQSSEATGVSGDGELVIGEATTQIPCFDCDCAIAFCGTTEVNPFLWDEARGMRDLADVLQLDYGLDLGEWDLREATAISDDGTTIIGNGTNPAGEQEAWRAVLHRETPDGDLDFDGDVDRHDYAALMANLGSNSETASVFYADGDLNADGLVDAADSAAMLGLYDYRYMGDFNADGLVNLADYTVWRDHFGRFTGGLADSNGDGWVNDLDLAAWRAHFGDAIGRLVPHAAPEPSSAVGVLLGLAAIGLRGRR